MNMEKELKKFAASYENEVQELLVLTSESVGGAGRVGKEIGRASCRERV